MRQHTFQNRRQARMGVLALVLLLGVAGHGCRGSAPPPPASTPARAAANPAPPAQSNRAEVVNNVGVVDIPDVSVYRQIVAISDNHGMYDNLKRLLLTAHIIDANGNWSAGSTLVLVVGDLIDKGPQSLEVLDLWMQLAAQAPGQGGRLVVLLGNHEAEFLADPDNKKAEPLREELEAKGLPSTALTDPGQPRGRFLREMPLAARVGGRWLFCHAGWPPALPWNDFVAKARSVLQQGDYANEFLLDDDSILEKRQGSHGGKWWEDSADVADLESRLTHDGLVGVVFGHQPQAFDLIGEVGPYRPDDHRLIKIDSGMAPDAGAHPGRLLVFPNPAELTRDQPPEHMTSVGP